MVYDPTRATCILHGGTPATDTWELRWVSEHPEERCDAAGDEDEDGLSDCADPDCEDAVCGARGLRCLPGGCACPGGVSELDCSDGFDEDCDGLLDCQDDDCSAEPRCQVEVDCDNGEDDDGDGLTDCEDPNCYLAPCTSITPVGG